MEEWDLFDAHEPLVIWVRALQVHCSALFVLLSDLIVNMEVRGVLQRNRIVQDNGEEHDRDQQPVWLHSILIRAHEIFPQIL